MHGLPVGLSGGGAAAEFGEQGHPLGPRHRMQVHELPAVQAQPGQPQTRGDHHRAAVAPGQQGADLGGGEGVVQQQRHGRVRGGRPPPGRACGEVRRCRPDLHAHGAEQHVQHVVGVGGLSGGEAVQVHEQLSASAQFRVRAQELRRQRGLAHPRRARDHHQCVAAPGVGARHGRLQRPHRMGPVHEDGGRGGELAGDAVGRGCQVQVHVPAERADLDGGSADVAAHGVGPGAWVVGRGGVTGGVHVVS